MSQIRSSCWNNLSQVIILTITWMAAQTPPFLSLFFSILNRSCPFLHKHVFTHNSVKNFSMKTIFMVMIAKESMNSLISTKNKIFEQFLVTLACEPFFYPAPARVFSFLKSTSTLWNSISWQTLSKNKYFWSKVLKFKHVNDKYLNYDFLSSRTTRQEKRNENNVV